jgi:hypothetical protein
VIFRAPAEGASAVLVGNPARVNAQGIAQVQAVANGIPGAYEVIVESAGAQEPVAITLTNLDPDPGPDLGDPVPTASSAQRALGGAARRTVEDVRGAVPRPSRVAPVVQDRATALSRALRQAIDSAGESGRALHPALARVLDQIRERNGSSSTPGTPISTT